MGNDCETGDRYVDATKKIWQMMKILNGLGNGDRQPGNGCKRP